MRNKLIQISIKEWFIELKDVQHAPQSRLIQITKQKESLLLGREFVIICINIANIFSANFKNKFKPQILIINTGINDKMNCQTAQVIAKLSQQMHRIHNGK